MTWEHMGHLIFGMWVGAITTATWMSWGKHQQTHKQMEAALRTIDVIVSILDKTAKERSPANAKAT